MANSIASHFQTGSPSWLSAADGFVADAASLPGTTFAGDRRIQQDNGHVRTFTGSGWGDYTPRDGDTITVKGNPPAEHKWNQANTAWEVNQASGLTFGIGATLPDATVVGAEDIFTLHSQANTNLNGVYEKLPSGANPGTHYVQRLTSASGVPFGSGTLLPDAATSTLTWFLLHSQTPANLNGFYENLGASWVQRSS